MIRNSKSVIGPEEKRAVLSVLDHEYLGMGPEVKAFEKELEVFLGGGVRALCVNTGTAALHLALQAIGLGPGDEVLVPSLTFVASFQAISATGATPIPCDVEELTGNLSLDDAEKRLSSKTRAVLPVHYAGEPVNLDAVHKFARSNSLRVIEDAAHAFGCLYGDQKIGSFGDIVCFSFDGIKNITSGEGGAVITKDPDIIARVSDARLLGVVRDSEKRYNRERSWDFDVTEQGWRYHMSDIMAAIGRVQLRRLENEFKPKRIALAERYRNNLRHCGRIKLFQSQQHNVVPFMVPIRILDGTRDKVRAHLLSKQIEAGIHYKPSHLLTKYGAGRTALPVAERLYEQILTLPLHCDLTHEDVDRICEELRAEM